MDDQPGTELHDHHPGGSRPDPGLYRPGARRSPPGHRPGGRRLAAPHPLPPYPQGLRARPRPVPRRTPASQPDAWEHLAAIRPEHVSQWRERLAADEQTNSTIRRKLTALRSLFSYLQTYGYSGANPAHGKFVKAPAVSRDGKTVGLSPHDCRRLLDAPQVEDQHREQANHPGRHPRPGHAGGAGLFRLPRRRAGAAPRPRLQDQRRAPHPQRHRQGRQGTHHAPAPGGRRAAGRLAGRARHQATIRPGRCFPPPARRAAWAAMASPPSR